MGITSSTSINSNQLRMEASESDLTNPVCDMIANNGLICNGIFIPEEILLVILDFVDCKTLLKTCKKVCRKWGNLTMEVFKIKSLRRYPAIANLRKNRVVPTYVYENIALTTAYDVNLLKNPSGENGLKNWKIKLNGGEQWLVENPPRGTSIPIDGEDEYSPRTCFATSYRTCAKEQIVDLHKHGFEPRILDTFQPGITVSEFYATRFDCGSIYHIKVCLLDDHKREVKNFTFRTSLTAGVDSWKKVDHTFRAYGPGVQYVHFYHEGKDTQFWAGHYGSKMTEASVVVSLTSLFENMLHI